jgi:ribosome-associated translation inhibitor RaiA
MQIQVNTDRNVNGHEGLVAQIKSTVESFLSLKSDHITRVEVHLSDESSNKKTKDDKRCVMEARIEGHSPVAVTHHAETIDKAVDGAAAKLIRLIENTLGRLHNQKNRSSNLHQII